jgi:hypothetical protein
MTLVVPRLTLVLMWTAGYSHRAFAGWFWPLLGFIAMPYTTCAYVIAINTHGGVRGWTLVLLIVAVLIDFSGHRSSTRASRRGVVYIRERRWQ